VGAGERAAAIGEAVDENGEFLQRHAPRVRCCGG
jgi:hypothetical protein